MDKNTLFQKLEDGIAAFREALEKHDGSTLKTLSDRVKNGVDAAKASFQQNERTQTWLEQIKKQLAALETSIMAGDKKLSASILDKAESLLKEYRDPAA